MAGVEGERWAALESNPTVMTEFCHKAGVPSDWQVVDVWGVDPDPLAFVPQPVVSLVLLFPSNHKDLLYELGRTCHLLFHRFC